MIHSVFFCSLGMTLTRQARQHGTSTTVVPALMTMCSHFLVSVKSKESVDTEQAKRLPFGRKQLEKKKKRVRYSTACSSTQRDGATACVVASLIAWKPSTAGKMAYKDTAALQS